MTTSHASIDTSPVLVWFRQDLRLNDNPALSYAAHLDRPIIAVYICDDSRFSVGGASKWWLHHSLKELEARLYDHGGGLAIYREPASSVLSELVKDYNIRLCVWNRRYHPQHRKQDQEIIQLLATKGCSVKTFSASLLWEPAEMTRKNRDPRPFHIFTPYWRRAQEYPIRPPLKNLRQGTLHLLSPSHSQSIDSLHLLPKKPNWSAGWQNLWQPGETGAQKQLQAFHHRVASYNVYRDQPWQKATSQLSAHLAFGDISPHQIHSAILQHQHSDYFPSCQVFLRQLAWREFSFYLLYHFPHIIDSSLRAKYHRMLWKESPGDELIAWQQGMTGYPFIDAAMRELYATGWMHNRARMVVASFLCKNLLIHWKLGAQWFMDTLVDACWANNSAGWQWVAGCGTDAAPYFRIFNPLTQAQKFDPQGKYILKWIPELKGASLSALHDPWQLTKKSTPTLHPDLNHLPDAHHYPYPLVTLQSSRKKALEAYTHIKQSSS